MNQIQLEKLISYEEGSNLDFKSKIDLDSKKGKADILVEILGLANAPSKPAYLVIGIEDKTRKSIGIPTEITEERLQKFIADNCRPPIECVFDVVPYKRKRIGILTIKGVRRPYVLKKDMSYSDEKGKQHTIIDKQVFVRRGTTGDTATPDEITEMALEYQTDTGDTGDTERELDEISTKLYHIDESINRVLSRKDRERTVEYIFVGILAGLVVGIFQVLGFNWNIATLSILLITFWVSVFASVLKIIRFGWMRSVIISLIVSAVFIGLSYLLDNYISQKIISVNPTVYILPIWAGVKGMLGGIVAAYLGRGEYEHD
jgi:hypothetical protein